LIRWLGLVLVLRGDALKHEQLWAPWRIGYITGDEQVAPAPRRELTWQPDADHDCFLCRGVADSPEADRQNLIVCRTPLSIVMLNRYPYNNGHLLIAPRRHQPRLDSLTGDEHVDLMQLVAHACLILEQQLKAEGFNIGLNLGKVAGAGLPGHLHWHVVPRWNGDTNFMPALAAVRVIPQSLEALVEVLQSTWKNCS
jgi:ATP adenylyltransferase